MVRAALIFLFSFLPLFFFVKTPVFAALFINEFSSDTSGTIVDPDWVEIYNNSETSSIDLSQYRLEDLNATNKKTLSGTIDPLGFITFDWSNKLNKAGDVISLIQISDSSLIDRVAYGDQGNDISAPGVGQSGGRQSDGAGTWAILISTTKGSTNNTSTPAPTATPTPTVVPTNTPTPTTAPTPTKTPAPKSSTGGAGATVTPKPISSPTSAPTKILALSSQAAGGSGNINTTISPTLNLTLTPTKEPTKKPTPTPIKSGQTAVLGVTQSNLSKVLIGLGIIFLATCGIIAFRSFRKAKNDESHY